jgi:hypothetical protein
METAGILVLSIDYRTITAEDAIAAQRSEERIGQRKALVTLSSMPPIHSEPSQKGRRREGVTRRLPGNRADRSARVTRVDDNV